jgi:hypothetical protein
MHGTLGHAQNGKEQPRKADDDKRIDESDLAGAIHQGSRFPPDSFERQRQGRLPEAMQVTVWKRVVDLPRRLMRLS